jgi:hypothetical protein
MGVGGDEFFGGIHDVSLRKVEATTWLQRGKNGNARKGMWVFMNIPLPYDGITRTGSKGLSQSHLIRCDTPNVKLKVLELQAIGKKSGVLR